MSYINYAHFEYKYKWFFYTKRFNTSIFGIFDALIDSTSAMITTTDYDRFKFPLC